jgi:hypothetical protein
MIELPKDLKLDGELFGGRGEFQSTVSIVKTINSPHWKGITFQVCPNLSPQCHHLVPNDLFVSLSF